MLHTVTPLEAVFSDGKLPVLGGISPYEADGTNIGAQQTAEPYAQQILSTNPRDFLAKREE